MPKFAKKRAYDEDSLDEESPAKPIKKSKPAREVNADLANGKDAEGNAFWELSSKRRVGVSKFKNLLLVNIREYYEADGELKPGKKGISLSVDQYRALLKAIPAINAELRSQGSAVEDPDEDASETVPKAKLKKSSSKANIEATSDEDSG